MTSFKSSHYPSSRKGLFVIQEMAMNYYAWLFMFVVLAVMVRMVNGQSILWLAIIGTILSLLIGNLMAYVKLKKSIAQILFLNEHFSLISIYDIIKEEKPPVFPIRYANAQRREGTITLHFNDQVITLKEEDWEDFDLIWGWLNDLHQPRWETNIS